MATRLRPHLQDSTASVRIAADEALVRHADDAAALDLLAAEINSRNERAATRAARALELLGEKARPKLAAMQDALNRRTSGFFGKPGPEPAPYALEFSLLMALISQQSLPCCGGALRCKPVRDFSRPAQVEPLHGPESAPSEQQ